MRNMSQIKRLQWKTVGAIILCWIIFGQLFNLLNYFFLKSIEESGGMATYSLRVSAITYLFIIPVAGLCGGCAIVFFLRERFRNYPLGISIAVNILTIMLLIVLLTIPGAFIYNSLHFGLSIRSDKVAAESLKIFRSYILWYNIFFWGLIAAVSIVVLHVNEKYGQGVFLNMLTGKYHRPKEECRIFMFLDIKSSTTIAESIGHEQWFMLLNDFYNDVTIPILNNRGQIYQYVGDEIVIDWLLPKGLKRLNCINCFYEVKAGIHKRSQYYLKRYGVVPDFKAAVHYGNVTVGEIGRIKKEIIFTGDTLNTCARILELCKTYEADLLISKELQDQLNGSGYYYEHVAELELRGKQQPVSISKVLTAATRLTA